MRLEDLHPPGTRVTTGTLTFTREDIIAFATDFDPQAFHLDEEAAQDSLFGGLCASGWHTAAGWMKTFVAFWMDESRRRIADGQSMPKLGPSPGFRDLKWLKPVYAGDSVTYAVTFLSARALASRPGWRLNTILCEGVNQNGDPVIRFESTVIEFP